MSKPFVSKWNHSTPAMESSYLDTYADDLSARPTGAVPIVRPTQPGMYEQPLSYIHSGGLDMSPKSKRVQQQQQQPRPPISSAEKRLK